MPLGEPKVCINCKHTEPGVKLAQLDGLEIHNILIDHQSFENWGESLRGKKYSVAGLEVVIADVLKDGDQFHDQWYDEAPQGWTGNASLVFKVTQPGYDPRFFKKSGSVNSYLGVEWGGKFEEVKMVEKTVTTYVYE